MEPEKAPRERANERGLISLLVSDWRPTPQQSAWAIRIVLALVVMLGILTLVGRPFDVSLWDWLKLLVVPAVIAGGGLWFSRQQRERELEIASQQREQDLEIAERRTQDEALQAYLDQMSNMLIPTNEQPSLYETQEGDSLRSVARARTLTVLRRLDKPRKVYVVQFLYESGLIYGAHPVLVDLHGADLREVYLTGDYMYGTNLSKANLSGAILEQAGLSGVILRDAYLVGARLQRAALSHTPLEGAHLNGALLEGANLHYASLSGADLSGAKGWTEEQLTAAKSLEGATMPDGQILKSDYNPNGPTYEDWLKDKKASEDIE